MSINEKIDEVLDRLTRVEEKIDTNNRDTAQLKKTIDGNGKPGLKMEVDRLKTFRNVSIWFLSAIVVMILSVIGRVIYVKISGIYDFSFIETCICDLFQMLQNT